MIAAGPQDLEDFGFILHGIELSFDRVRLGHHQTERKSRREHLDEDGFHELANFRATAPHINNTKRQFDGYGF
jgi:hypothetical protein